MRFDRRHPKLPPCVGVSCLCVTRNRVDMLAKAIQCFNNQTYRDRELIIMVPADDVATLKYKDTIVQDNIFWIVDDPKLSLGERRNLSKTHAHYDYVMIWDDDDWYSDYRIQASVTEIIVQNVVAVFADRAVTYDNTRGIFSLSTNTAVRENTMLACKAYVPKYPSLPRSEDTAMVAEMTKNHRIYISERLTQHYIYVYHGNNICSKEHFNEIMYTHGAQCVPEFQNEFLAVMKVPMVLVAEDNRAHTTRIPKK